MMKLFSKSSNLCDHNSPTLQTDRQTTCDRNTALCTKVHRAVKTHHVANQNFNMSLVYHVKYEIPMLTIFLCTVSRICFKRSQKQHVCVQYYYCYEISLNAENVLLCGTHTHIYVCRVVADALTLYCRC